MIGSFRTLGVTLGAAIVGAMSFGCSHARQPAKTPSPTFESNVPEQTVPPPMGTTAPPMGERSPAPMGGPGAAAMPENEPPATPATPEPAPSAAPMGTEMPAPSTTEPAPSMAPTPAPAMVSDLCDSLTHAATMRQEDVPGGVAIVLTPKAHETMDTVRDDARKFQMTFTQLSAEAMGHPSAGAAAPMPSPSTCALGEVVHMAVSASVSEGPKAVRILLTSSDPGQVRPVRRTVRDYTRSAGGRGAPGGKTGGKTGGAGHH